MDKSSKAESSKKRGRKSQAADTDEEGSVKAPKRRKSLPAKSEAVEKIADIVVDEDENVKNMSDYYNRDTWEDLVEMIDTVETDNKVLWVYFRL